MSADFFDEDERDAAILAWIGRFEFCTAAPLAARWGVSEQRMRARLRRLEREKRVRRVRGLAHRPVTVTLTGRGGAEVGLPVYPRRAGPPRLAHEIAILKRVIAVEAHFAATGDDGRVLTERDLRRAEAQGEGRFHVEVLDPRGRRRRRWPDYVVDVPAGLTAVELEFSAKAAVRLKSIVQGYSCSAQYRFVDFVLLERPQDEALRRRFVNRSRIVQSFQEPNSAQVGVVWRP